MDFLELAKKRYSVRQYKPEKVEKEKLDKILEAGRVAPTGANRQPQRIIVVESAEGLEKAGRAAKIFGAPLIFIICADTSETWVRPFDGKKLTDIDASIVTDHMMLEAASLGLGSVWICRFEPEILRKEFDIPKEFEPVNILAVGYAEGDPSSPDRHAAARKPLSGTVFFEKL